MEFGVPVPDLIDFWRLSHQTVKSRHPTVKGREEHVYRVGGELAAGRGR